MSVVAVKRCGSYADARGDVRKLLDLLGGPEKFVKRGGEVLVKPNMLSPAATKKAVTTNPAILDTVLEILSDLGVKAVVGDSPGFGGARLVGKVSGLAEVCRRHDVKMLDLGDGDARELGLGLYKDVKVSSAALDALTIWNLPKWKTHTMMGLTLGVKNLYGCVPGARKVGGHLRAGKSHDAFATMLLDLWVALKPTLTLLDGVVGMEGAGPGHGEPKERGLLLASADAPALDLVATRLSGFSTDAVTTVRLSIKNGILDPASVTLVGDEAEIMRFEPAPGSVADFSFLPNPLKRLLRGALSPAPSFSGEKCIDCSVCVKACPAAALKPGKPPVLDKELCIRCYCCQELCPQGAVSVSAARILARGRHT